MRIVKIKSITKIECPSRKYDIQTSNSNYYANGVLVHNCTMYRDYIHGRSPKPLSGQDSSIVKGIHAKLAYDIPEGWRICGEDLSNMHSIHYHELESYFQVFSIWNEQNECLSWSDTVEWSAILGLCTVPVLYQGPWDEAKIQSLYSPQYRGNDMEGYVVRVARAFPYRDFRSVVGKYVKPKFIAGRHDYHRRFVANELKSTPLGE